jgi:hypothetical protein
VNAFPTQQPPVLPGEAAPGESQREYEIRIGKITPDAPPAPAQQVPLAAQVFPGQAPPAQVPAQLAQMPAGALEGEPQPVEDRQVTHNEPLLATGASGEPVERLCKLLAHAGFATNTIVKGENPANVLDNSVMADVERFWAAYPDAREPDELYAGREGSIESLRGSWVGPHTWQKLYELAGAAVAPQSG